MRTRCIDRRRATHLSSCSNATRDETKAPALHAPFYGTEAYLARLTDTIRIMDTNDPRCHQTLTCCLGIHRTILTHSAFRPYFYSTGFARAFCEMSWRESSRQFETSDTEGALQKTLIMRSVLQILRLVPIPDFRKQCLTLSQSHNRNGSGRYFCPRARV